MICEHCGVSGEKEKLYDVIHEDKLVRMCRRCADFENVLVVRESVAKNEIPRERTQTVYERMVKMSGVQRDLSNVKKLTYSDVAVTKKEPMMRDIVERNLKKDPQQNVIKREDLINNYHWVIMRARRARKISQEQLAKEIGENLSVMINIEKGIPPSNNIVINKLEEALKVKLFFREQEQEYFSPAMSEEREEVVIKVPRDRPIVLDKEIAGALTIGDLKELEPEKKVPYWKKLAGKIFGDGEEVSEEEFSEMEEDVPSIPEPVVKKEQVKKRTQPKTEQMSKRDLSSREINELIFGRKDKK